MAGNEFKPNPPGFTSDQSASILNKRKIPPLSLDNGGPAKRGNTPRRRSLRNASANFKGQPPSFLSPDTSYEHAEYVPPLDLQNGGPALAAKHKLNVLASVAAKIPLPRSRSRSRSRSRERRKGNTRPRSRSRERR